jgi:membrane protein YqaA with SNARE-associated domain
MTFTQYFSFFLTWWGLLFAAALDSSLFFFVPFGTDMLVVYMVARNRDLFWLYPVLTTTGSLAGAAATYWIGHKIGEKGVAPFVARRQFDRFKARVQNAGATALALPAVLPPPFPLTAFVLTSGALEVNRRRFFGVFGAARVVRFGVEAALARRYGRRVLDVMESDAFHIVVIGFILVAVAGTVVSVVAVWRRTRYSSE